MFNDNKIILIGVDQHISSWLQLSLEGLQIYTAQSAEDVEAIGIELKDKVSAVIYNKDVQGVEVQTLASIFKCKVIYFSDQKSNSSKYADIALTFPNDSEKLIEELKIIFTEVSADEYASIVIPNLKVKAIMLFDVYTYLKLNNKYVIYVKSGVEWSEKKVSAIDENIKLFVKKDDYQKYATYLSDMLHGRDKISDTLIEDKKYIQVLFSKMIDEKSLSGAFSKASMAAVSSYISHDTSVPWNDSFAKYSVYVQETKEAEAVSTMAVLLSLTCDMASPEDIGYASYFIALIRKMNKTNTTFSILSQIKEFLSQEKIIIPDVCFDYISEYDAFCKDKNSSLKYGTVIAIIDLSLNLKDNLKSIDVLVNEMTNMNCFKDVPINKLLNVLNVNHIN